MKKSLSEQKNKVTSKIYDIEKRSENYGQKQTGNRARQFAQPHTSSISLNMNKRWRVRTRRLAASSMGAN